MDKTTLIFILGGILLLGLTVIIVTLVLMRSKKKEKLKEEINNLEMEKNLIISPDILSELAQVEALINNEYLKKKFEDWTKRFENIKNNEISKLTDKILELEMLLDNNNFKELDNLLPKNELEIYYLKTKMEFLTEEIREITLSEKRNRELITKLKTIYREIINKYNKSKNEYKDIAETIELQFENIDKLLGAFESAMDKKEYENIGKIVRAITNLIQNIKMVIDEGPTIIFMGSVVIPKKINEIKNIYRKMTKDGYNLEYLNIDYNIEEASKKLNDILDKLKVLNLEDSIFELKTMLDYFESLYSDFEKEKTSKKLYEQNIFLINDKISRMFKLIKNLYLEISDLKSSYDLSDDELKLVEGIRKQLITLRDEYKLLSDRTQAKIIPFSKLYSSCEFLLVKIATIEDNLETTLRNLESLKEDEIRAREQLVEIREILKSSKRRVKEFKLPLIPKKYYVELEEAADAVGEIIKELEHKPISIKTLNTRVDTARDLALKLYNTCNETYKTASMAEMSIVYGNRYRSSYKEIDNGLIKAEKEFQKGNYKESLEIAINTLNLVEPGIHKKLMNSYAE